MSGEDYMAALRNKILAEVGTTKGESKGGDAGKDARQGSQVGGSNGGGNSSSNWGRSNSTSSSSSRFNDTRRGNYGGENRKQDSRRGPVPTGPSSGRQSRFQWNSGGNNNNNTSSGSSNGSRFQPNRRPEKKPVHSRNNNGQDGSSVPPWSRPSGDMNANGNVNSSNNNRSRFDRSRGRTFHRQSPSPDQAFADANRRRNASNRVTAVHSEESVFANVTDVRFNKMVIISPMTPGFSEHVVVGSTIKKFVESLDYDVGATENKVENVSVEKNRIIIEFNKVSLVPIVLACQKHLETILSSQFIWQRPSSYIVDTSNKDPILSENVHALMKLEPECEDESSTRQWLIDEKIEYTWIHFLKLKSGSNGDGNGNDAGNWVKALLYLPKSEDQVKLPMTIRPNHGTRRQDFKQITFENFATIAKSYEKKPSKVVCILNCVDPMDLKNENFVTEIKEAMMYGTPIQKCGEVESVQVPLPNPDFRNDIKHIHSSIGKVFIKFKDLVSAERAMILLPGTQFCQRTILCTYYSEVDYDMGIL
ncbi:splicing factor MUD2 [Kluyveromyces marxianus DMKU3-1042]|uniref:Splicing factor MUD2 n=1 Tax=Kluyveromyces marxianus (strain DMKU3-1042 / BCC 29191 / NBRC 104275) TaxID=1003335 RepID=W0TF94_KLUMD|nr:splicing factor MUD2 [Kluyveromyces marxianus DMKU3-1042]BAO41481.1 splicing factor MUD2 [Kluyveromyces marxianus DMKU3-1042]